MSASPQKYNSTQVVLHWLIAVLVLFMLMMGHFVLAQTANSDPIKTIGLRGHMTIGIVLLVLTLIRIVWRRKSVQPAHATTGNPLLDKLGVAAHYALNIFTLLVALSGIGIAIQSGLPEIILGGQGELPVDFADYPARFAHGLLTKLLAVLVVIHILGGLYHQFILRDGLFKRIWFGKSDG